MKILSRIFSVLACASLLISSAQASIVPSIPYNLTNGSLADATQVMGNFNTIVSDVNANGAHNGVNNDITSITGLTTPLSNAQGGTNTYTGSVSTGSGNAQVFGTISPLNFSLTAGNTIIGVAGFSNSGATTLNVAGTGVTAVDIVTVSGLTALSGSEITADGVYGFFYDGTEYILLNPNINGVYAPLASPAFTGNPTAPTQAAGNSSTLLATTAFVNGTALTLASGSTAVTQSVNDISTKVATTAFANPANSLGSAGYQELPSGLIIEWGVSTSVAPGGTTSVTFPLAFPNACFNVQNTVVVASPDNGVTAPQAGSASKTGFIIANHDTDSTLTNVYWFAIGD